MVSVREAIEQGDLTEFEEVLAPDVVWLGRYPGEICRNREEVLAMLREAQEHGIQASPEIVLERDDLLVVDPHLDGRHQVLVLRDGFISEVRAYLSREDAIALVEGRPW
jgi:ketosteroid isomerase-like protein